MATRKTPKFKGPDALPPRPKLSVIQVLLLSFGGLVALAVIFVVLSIVLADIWQRQDFKEARERCGTDPIVILSFLSFGGGDGRSYMAYTPQHENYEKVKLESNNFFAWDYVIAYVCNKQELHVKYPYVHTLDGKTVEEWTP